MIKVLIVDDSPLIRGLLKEILGQANGIEVVGTAEDPFQARELIKSTNPDVLTLDIEMPKMNFADPLYIECHVWRRVGSPVKNLSNLNNMISCHNQKLGLQMYEKNLS